MIIWIINDKAFDRIFVKTIDKTSGFINGGCLVLGVIQSTRQFPDFILKATEHFSLRLPSRIYPTPRTRRSTPPRNSPKTSNHSVTKTLPLSNSLDPAIRIDLYSCKRCTLYPRDTITHVSREREVS